MTTTTRETGSGGDDADARELAAVDKLVECLHHEVATVDGYDRALNHAVDPDVSQKLLELLTDHGRRAELLRNRIQGRRASPTHEVVGPPVEPTVEALALFEDRALELCREGVLLDDVPTRDFFENVLLPAQKRTHDICRSLDREPPLP